MRKRVRVPGVLFAFFALVAVLLVWAVQKPAPLQTPTAEQFRQAFPGDARRVLETGPSFVLYALDPHPFVREKEAFHGFGVWGKTRVTDPNERAVLLAALYDGVARSDQTMAACFNPRHGVRVTQNKRTLDLVICFECRQFAVYDGGKKTLAATSGTPRAVFDRVLDQAGVRRFPR